MKQSKKEHAEVYQTLEQAMNKFKKACDGLNDAVLNTLLNRFKFKKGGVVTGKKTCIEQGNQEYIIPRNQSPMFEMMRAKILDAGNTLKEAEEIIKEKSTIDVRCPNYKSAFSTWSNAVIVNRPACTHTFEPEGDIVGEKTEIENLPLGAYPMKLWVEERLCELKGAMKRYKDAGHEIPEEWFTERHMLDVLSGCKLVRNERHSGGKYYILHFSKNVDNA